MILDTAKYGGFMITKSITSGKSPASFWVREIAFNDKDNGWRIMGGIDSEEYVNDSANWEIIGINTMYNICPLVLEFFDAPIGTELFLNIDGNNIVKEVYDLKTDSQLNIDNILEGLK